MTYHPTNDELKQRVRFTVELLTDLLPNADIVKQITDKYKVSRPTAYSYIAKAEEALKEMSDGEDLATVRNKHKRFIKKQIRDSEGKQKSKWYELLCKLYPNELTPESESSESSLTIVYKEAKKDE